MESQPQLEAKNDDQWLLLNGKSKFPKWVCHEKKKRSAREEEEKTQTYHPKHSNAKTLTWFVCCMQNAVFHKITSIFTGSSKRVTPHHVHYGHLWLEEWTGLS